MRTNTVSGPMEEWERRFLKVIGWIFYLGPAVLAVRLSNVWGIPLWRVLVCAMCGSAAAVGGDLLAKVGVWPFRRKPRKSPSVEPKGPKSADASSNPKTDSGEQKGVA
jgi:hypothetical protein